MQNKLLVGIYAYGDFKVIALKSPDAGGQRGLGMETPSRHEVYSFFS